MTEDEAGVRPAELPPREDNESVQLVVERTLRSCEAVLDCYLCVHDVSGSFRSASGERLLLPSRIIHQAPVCRHHHTQRCLEHCAARVHEASLQRGVFRHHCWKGVSELVVPVMRGKTQLALIYAGVLRSDVALVRRLPKTVQDLRRQLAPTHQHSDEQIADVLRSLADYLVLCLERVQADHDIEVDDRRSVIARWLRSHAAEPVGLGDLARHLSLSKSRCSHLVQECMGESFRSLLLHERLEKARLLLINNPWQPLRIIAQHSGFGDEHHFSRMFRQRFGEAPGRYRKQYQSQA